ncbi:hypothetical protein Tco_0661057, partial [Tanacetum coccineum]
PMYPEYLAPSNDDLDPAEAQPLPASVSPTALLPDYSADSEPFKEDLEEEPSEEEEEELSASADSPPAGLYIDLPSEGTDVCPTSDPLPSSIDALVDSWIAAPIPPLQPPLQLPSPLSPLSSPLPRIPSPPLLIPSPTCRDIIPEADMPPRKRARFAAPSQRFEIRESSAAAAARQPMSTLARGTDYGFVTALEEVNERVTDLATSYRQDSHEFYVRHQDAQDDRAVLQARVSSLERQRRYHRTMAIVVEQEAIVTEPGRMLEIPSDVSLSVDSGCSKAHVLETKPIFQIFKDFNGGNVIFIGKHRMNKLRCLFQIMKPFKDILPNREEVADKEVKKNAGLTINSFIQEVTRKLKSFKIKRGEVKLEGTLPIHELGAREKVKDKLREMPIIDRVRA